MEISRLVGVENITEILSKLQPDSGVYHKADVVHIVVKVGTLSFISNLTATATDNKITTSVLTAAVEAERLDVINALLRKGIDVNAFDYVGTTALIAAAKSGQIECLKLLLNAGADVNVIDEKAHQMALMKAASEGQLQCIEILIDAGADVNATAHGSNTALTNAATNDHKDCVRFLIQAGADVNITGPNNETALLAAAVEGHVECINILLQAGADINAVYDDCLTALHVAAGHGNNKCVQFLVQTGVNVNSKSKYGDTPLIVASREDRRECLESLVAVGADVNMVNNEGLTALMVAKIIKRTKSESLPCAQLLLKSGARINNTNVFGQNALETYPNYTSYSQCINRNTSKLLFAAGEKFKDKITHKEVIQVIKELRKEQRINLKDICREAIRNHLIEWDLHVHLFERIPRLGLPFALNAFLLYYMSIEAQHHDTN